MREEAVTFENAAGRALVGVVHLPDAPGAGVGVNLVCPGIKYRVAPGRLYVRIARDLCRRGYTVLRFDPEGIGDIWVQIQQGRFVPDVRAANDLLVARYGIRRLVLAGNCGGAITALLAAAEDPRVAHLCLVDPPVYLWAADRSFADKAVAGGEKLDWLFVEYLRRLARPRSWARFLTLKTDYRALATVLGKKLKGLRRGAAPGLPADFEEVCRANRLNDGFFRAYQAFRARGGEELFVLAGNDPGIDAFRSFFLGWCLGGGAGAVQPSRVEVVERANHVYTLGEWQEKLVAAVGAWLGEVAPAGQDRRGGRVPGRL